MFKFKDVKYKDILSIPSLNLREKDVTAVIGESGGGKTTFLKLLNHMISPDDGTIFYNEKSIETMDPIQLRREVVMLPQQPVMFDGTVHENLTIGFEFAEIDTKPSEKVLKDLLDQFHLHIGLDEEAENLSGGEKQRVAFARLLLMDAPVYLLDEPTSALDDETEDRIMEQLMTFTHENGKTVVMVTHSKHLAETYSDQIIRIEDLDKDVTT